MKDRFCPGVFLCVALLACPAAAESAEAVPIGQAFLHATAERTSGPSPEVTIRGVILEDPVNLSAGIALADIQDPSGGATLFTNTPALLVGRVQRGDLVMATGKVRLYSGNNELVLTDIGRIGRAELPLPKDVKAAEVLDNKYNGQLVRVNGRLQAEPTPLLRDSTGAIAIQVPARLLQDEKFAARLAQGGDVAVVGICNRSKSSLRLLTRDEADFHFAPRPPYGLITLATGGGALLGLAALALAQRRNRRRVERELRAEAKLAAAERDRFFSLSLDLLCVAYPDGKTKRLNPAASRILGWSTAELMARPFMDLVHPDDRAAAGAALSALNGGEPVSNLENRCQHRNGSWRVLSWHAVRDGEAIYAAARDVTEQHRAAANLRTLNEQLEERVLARTAEVRQALATLDATEDAAFIFDPDSLRFSYVNAGAVKLLGYERAALLAMTPLDLEPTQDAASFLAVLTPMLQGERRSLQVTTFYQRRDGGRVAVEINLQYVAPAGERPRFISMVRDITERRKVESALRRSQRLDALGTMAGGIAHDINNALAPVMMGLGALRAKYPSDQELIDMLLISVRRGADMVDQLLNFAKRPETDPTAVAPSRLLEEMQQLAKHFFPKNIRVEMQCAPDVPDVLGDPTQLHQVLVNLCVNARDAMPEGGTLTLKAESIQIDAARRCAMPEAEADLYVLLRISDTGSGMTPEIAEHIFDPFFTTKSSDHGTGLGLASVLNIVKGHGGFVRVDTEVGRGSTFTVYLPSVPRKGPGEPAAASASELHGRQEKILIVDDEPAVRTVAALVLERFNFEPLLAASGESGLAQAAEHEATLGAVVTDLHMPSMSGVDFIRALRVKQPDVPVLVISGRLQEAERQECSKLGVRVFITKPFTERALVDSLNRALAGTPSAEAN